MLEILWSKLRPVSFQFLTFLLHAWCKEGLPKHRFFVLLKLLIFVCHFSQKNVKNLTYFQQFPGCTGCQYIWVAILKPTRVLHDEIKINPSSFAIGNCSRLCQNVTFKSMYTSFYKQRLVSTQPQYCLTFLWIELQMLLKVLLNTYKCNHTEALYIYYICDHVYNLGLFISRSSHPEVFLGKVVL